MKKAKKSKAKKVKLQLKRPKKEKPTLINFKVVKSDLKAIEARAKKFAGGNLSLWLRHAGLKYTPKRKDLSP